MKALILAAGRGTRLKPFTNTTPKALLNVADKNMLERVLEQVNKIGIREIAVNVFHFADQIKNFIARYLQKHPEIKIELIHETQLLETGGAIQNAKDFLQDSDPFLIHNVDIIHNIDLGLLIDSFKSNHLAVLAVKDQPTSRPWLVDKDSFICGHRHKIISEENIVRQPVGELKEKRFCGVHVVSNKIFNYLKPGHYSITPKYLELIAQGLTIRAFDIGDAYYADMGTPEKIREVESLIQSL